MNKRPLQRIKSNHSGDALPDKDLSEEDSRILKHPLLLKISSLTYRLARIRITAVFPSQRGWEQLSPKGEARTPSFCRMIQSSHDGAKHCRMCHVLMTVAACSSGSTEQKCHAGISVLVCPTDHAKSERGEAILSSCIFTSSSRSKAWKEAMSRGRKLAIDIPSLKKAFYELPVLSHDEAQTVTAFMEIAAEALKEIRSNAQLLDKIARAKKHIQLRDLAETTVVESLKTYGKINVTGRDTSRPLNMPAVLSVVSETVKKRPHYSFNVSEIAAAARMTPNHFSALFHKHCGQTFSDFVTEVRIARAKELLGDFTLNISEVASRTGFDDPGYFARRFRQYIGCSPREWRERLSA